MPRKPNKPCAGCGKLCWPSRHDGAPAEHWCQECRRSGRRPGSAWRCGTTASYDKRGCRCEDCKSAKRAARDANTAPCRACGEVRPKAARGLCRTCYSAQNRPKESRAYRIHEVECEWCGETKSVTKKDARFCSPDCYAASIFTGAKRSPHERTMRQWRAIQRRDAARRGTSDLRPWYVDSDGVVRRHLSHRPKWRITRSRRLAIYERDDWTCQLCGDPVDPQAKDEWRASLDHIIPRSHGGDDTDDNLQLAHLWCNSVKGDERYYTADDLRIA